MEKNKKAKCIIKNCENERYKDMLLCESHWKERQKKEGYKRKRDNW